MQQVILGFCFNRSDPGYLSSPPLPLGGGLNTVSLPIPQMALEQVFFHAGSHFFFIHIESFAFMLRLITKASCRGGLDAYSKLTWDPYVVSLKPVDSFIIQALNYELNVHLTSYILISLMNQKSGGVTDCRAAAVWALRAKVSTHFIYHTNDQFWSLNTGAAWKNTA